MANQYRSVLASGGASTGGDAVASEVLSGKTFTNDNGLQTGTMPNRGAVSGTASPTQPYTIPEGYHNGSGTVTASGVDAPYFGMDVNSITYRAGTNNTITFPVATVPTCIINKRFTKFTVNNGASIGFNCPLTLFKEDGTSSVISGQSSWENENCTDVVAIFADRGANWSANTVFSFS